MADQPSDHNEDAPTIGANTPEESLLTDNQDEETVVNPVGDDGDLPGDPPEDAGNQETPEDQETEEKTDPFGDPVSKDPFENDPNANADWNLEERDKFLANGNTEAPPLETLVDEDE